MRIGLGYDLHKLKRGKKLMLGGVHIPYKKGEGAHSDGDVLLHALIDSLLGACAMGDIGEFFPPEDNKWKGYSSLTLLEIVWHEIQKQGWVIENIDCVIIIENPKILPFRQAICESIAKILNINANQIFIKAKTGEKIGIIGKGKAVAAFVSCLVK